MFDTTLRAVQICTVPAVARDPDDPPKALALLDESRQVFLQEKKTKD